MTNNCKKITVEKKNNFTEEAFSSQNRTSNTSKHEIFKFFLLLLVFFALVDPDPDSESGSTAPFESGFNWDPDQQPCSKVSDLVYKINNSKLIIQIDERSLRGDWSRAYQEGCLSVREEIQWRDFVWLSLSQVSVLKGLSHEIDFKNIDKNVQNLA